MEYYIFTIIFVLSVMCGLISVTFDFKHKLRWVTAGNFMQTYCLIGLHQMRHEGQLLVSMICLMFVSIGLSLLIMSLMKDNKDCKIAMAITGAIIFIVSVIIYFALWYL